MVDQYLHEFSFMKVIPKFLEAVIREKTNFSKILGSEFQRLWEPGSHNKLTSLPIFSWISDAPTVRGPT